VDPTSAVIGLAGHREQVLELDRDHRQICKFIQDSDFNRVARHLKRLADAAIRNVIPANAIHSGIQGSPQSLSSAPDVVGFGDPLYSRPRTESKGCASRYHEAVLHVRFDASDRFNWTI
jgi:hypothetical protein